MGIFDSLFKPAWMSEKNEEKALRSVGKETDQIKLAEIAKNAPLINIRIAAIERLTDQKTIIDVVNYWDDDWIKLHFSDIRKFEILTFYREKRVELLEKLINNNSLVDIAKNSKDWYIRRGAVKKLTDQKLLIDFAKNDRNYEIRYAAAEKLTDQTIAQNVFVDYIKNTESPYYQRMAIKKVTDQTLLADVAKNANDNEMIGVCCDAVENLTDQVLLADVAKNAKNKWTCCNAVKKLTDRTLLADVAENANNEGTRRYAINVIDPQRYQELVFMCTHEWRFRTTIEERNSEDFSLYYDIYECIYCGLSESRYISDSTIIKR